MRAGNQDRDRVGRACREGIEPAWAVFREDE